MKTFRVLAFSLLFVLCRCDGSSATEDCPFGTELCPCNPEGECNSGLACVENICAPPTEDTLSTEEEAETDTDTGIPKESSTESASDTKLQVPVDTEVGFDTSTTDEMNTGVDTDDGLSCAENNGRLDEDTNLCWQYPKPAGELGWKEAISYCENLSLGGYSDWNLPKKQDFIDLLGDCDIIIGTGGLEIWRCNSCLESEKCSKLFGSGHGRYWLVEPSPENCEAGWTGSFSSGVLSFGCRDSSNVRCVRAEK